MSDQAQADEAGETELVPWCEFLESSPPGTPAVVEGAARMLTGYGQLLAPDLQLHCPGDSCNSRTFFFASSGKHLPVGEAVQTFLWYECRNCQTHWKTYALSVELFDNSWCSVFKFGEDPPFGPPISKRVLSLVGGGRRLFLQGLRSENRGFGIGALAYYRRVVENQWATLVGEIIKVAKTVGASDDELAQLQSAKDQTQFAQAVANVKDAIPQSLRIDGHNPLTLLYSALSDGVHELSDAECLKQATFIRVVLFDLADNLANALKDKKELKAALTGMFARKKAKAASK